MPRPKNAEQAPAPPGGPYVKVAVPLPVTGLYHYAAHPRHHPHLMPGVRVLVPFAGRKLAAFVLGVERQTDADPAKIKEIIEVLDAEPVIDAEGLALAKWVSGYYHHPLGEVLFTFLPPAARAARKIAYESLCGEPPEGLPDALRVLHERIGSSGTLDLEGRDGVDPRDLDRLCELGLVRRVWSETAFAKPRPRRWAALTDHAPDPGTLGENRRALAALLRRLKSAPAALEELRALDISADTVKRAHARGWITLESEERGASDGKTFGFGGEGERTPTPAQAEALAQIAGTLGAGEFAPILLHGVTGSGKTEIYLRAADEALKMGLGVLVLVPEIGLTPQLLGRFGARLGQKLAVLHSGLTDLERGQQWDAARSGEARVVVGTRSAVFAPVKNLGLILIDEEHEGSYKQEEGLRYNAKHVALVRAQKLRIPIVLGSATPDLETFHHAQKGRYRFLTLPERVGGAAKPRIRLIDLTQEEARKAKTVLIGEELKNAVDQTLARGEQALIFINRRGFAPALYCTSCQDSHHCPNCAVPMTLHRNARGGRLVCHYCGVVRKIPETCPKCASPSLIELGAGTQKVEELAASLWPEARLMRLDRDTAARSDVRGLLADFSEGHADILIGTQMVAKGHHFPRLTLVGVINADDGLHLPDYRAGERTYQMLTQVAGRAGREAERPGTVLIQTRNKNHPVLKAAVEGDYARFAAAELAERKDAHFPPFARLALVRVSATSENGARQGAVEIARELAALPGAGGVDLLGPAPSPIERIKNWHRQQLLLRFKTRDAGAARTYLGLVEERLAKRRGPALRLSLDVDPLTMI